MTRRADIHATVQAMKGGAFEFLIKPVVPEVLLDSIRAALERSEAARRHLQQIQALQERYESLSRREREVISLLVRGRLNKQVGGELGISEITVKAHRGRMMRKIAPLLRRARNDGCGPARRLASQHRRFRHDDPIVRRCLMNTRSCIAILCLACAPLAHAADDNGQFYGLLRSRDLSPFGFLRLDMRPAHAVAIEPGSWAIETEIGYQNTWALSPEVERYLVSLEPTGRRRIGPAEVQAILDLPGENYLLDIESALFDMTFHYKLSRNWTAYAIASAISYQGGFLDSAIEGSTTRSASAASGGRRSSGTRRRSSTI